MRIALLDDYQHVARASTDWHKLPAGCDLQVFHDRLADEDTAARQLADFDIVKCGSVAAAPIDRNARLVSADSAPILIAISNDEYRIAEIPHFRSTDGERTCPSPAMTV